MPKVRRPLIALIVLVAALVIGYLINALSDDNSSPKSEESYSATYPPAGDVGALALVPLKSDWAHAVRVA